MKLAAISHHRVAARAHAHARPAHADLRRAVDAFEPVRRALVALLLNAPQTGAVDPYRQLIAADMRMAYGREATQGDYDYWLPKLQGECDSGFVTSGQMTGTEYWHRRMLGWQAGGSDRATSGPYAGGSDAHGPVPSATDVVSALG